MDFLLEPNVAYLVLLSGVVLSLLALASPGTGMLELGAFFMLALAGSAVYNIEFIAWALGFYPQRFSLYLRNPETQAGRFPSPGDPAAAGGFDLSLCDGKRLSGSQSLPGCDRLPAGDRIFMDRDPKIHPGCTGTSSS
jgi:hypothetical protein